MIFNSLLILDTKEWLSTDRDRVRMATFGSRANLPPPPATSAASVANVKNDSTHNNTTSQHAGVIDVTDETWKADLEVGSLLDARDTAQVWYQVSPRAVHACNHFAEPFD